MLPGDTDLGRGEAAFPSTLWSRISRAQDPADPASRAEIEGLCRRYWRPIYAYVRSAGRLSPESP